MPLKKCRNSETGLSFMGFVFLMALIGGGIYLWIFHIEPFLFDQKFSTANLKFEFNNFVEAKKFYDALLPQAPPSMRQTLEDRINQLPLAQKHLGEPAPSNPSIDLKFVEGYIAKMGLIYIHYSIQNLSQSPIPVRRSLLYIKSNIGKCEVALDRPQNIEVNSWDGDLKPGEKAEGAVCVKYQLVDPNEQIFLVYNNGQLYANSQIPISRISGLPSISHLNGIWLGKKFDAIQMPAKQTPSSPSAPKPYKSPQQRAREIEGKANERYAI